MSRFYDYARFCILVFLLTVFSVGTVNAQSNNAKTLNFPYYDPTVQATTTCGGGSLVGNDNEEKVWYYLVNKGMTAIQAAGAMGNLKLEGGFEPRQVEIAYSDPPHLSDTVPPNIGPAGQPGYGIVQWTSPGRKQGLIDFAASKGLPVNDLGLQLDYMWSELEGPYKNAALNPLLSATDLAEAVSIWQDRYEVGAGFQPRFEFAQEMLVKYGSGVSIVRNGSGCELDSSGCPTAPISLSETVTVAGSIRVHPCIAEEVERIIALAQEQGLDMSGGGYRDSAGQIETRRNNCGTSEYDIYEKPANQCSPPTARPGASRHERGTAVDFGIGQ
jgi:hypothetical protein